MIKESNKIISRGNKLNTRTRKRKEAEKCDEVNGNRWRTRKPEIQKKQRQN